MLSLWPLLLAALLATGVGLMWLGWRGRRIDDHPLCRRCGYDLVGSEASTIACPECGTDLSGAHAVRIGHRRKIRLALVLGMLVLLSTVGGGGAIGWGVAKGFDFNPYKPLWLLRQEAVAASHPQRAVAAEREILTRLTSRKLSQGQINDIIKEALAAQSDRKAAWFPWWGDFIEQAWLNKDIGDDLAMQYVRQAVEGAISLEVPARVREQGMLMVYFNHEEMRAGRMGTFVVDVDRGPVTLEDGTEIDGGGGRSSMTVAVGNTGRGGGGSTMRLPLGTHTAAMEATVRVDLSTQRGSRNNAFASVTSMRSSFNMGGRSMSRQFGEFRSSTSSTFSGIPPALAGTAGEDASEGEPDKPLAEWTLKLEAPLEVVPPDAELVELVRDDTLADRIRRSAIVERCKALSAGSITMFDCGIDFVDLPLAVAFDVSARVPGEVDAQGNPLEWPVRSVAVDASSTHRLASNSLGSPRHRTAPPLPAGATKVDLVLRTNKRLAEQAGLGRVWDGEIVIKDVSLERIGPGRAPGAGGRTRRTTTGNGPV